MCCTPQLQGSLLSLHEDDDGSHSFIKDPTDGPDATRWSLRAMVTRAPSAAERGDALQSARILRDFEPLLPAESVLLRAVATGDIAKIAFRRPRTPSPDVRLRSEFLSFLARGGSAGARVEGHLLQIVGACIVGRVDLAGATVPMSLWLYRCLLGAAPRLDGAHVMGSVTFADCAMPGLQAEGCRIDGDLALKAGCRIDGEIVLSRACIARDLNCERMRPGDGAPSEHKFIADGARIGCDVILSPGFESVGEVRFMAAHIGGDLCASAARLTAAIDDTGGRGVALNLDRARVGGSVRLDGGVAAGQVRLQQARIEGDFDCAGAAFDVAGDASWGDNRSTLLLDRARIGGALILRQLREPLQGASLADARVGTLIDDASTWGERHVLDGFCYSRLGADAPMDASMRLGWLGRQDASPRGRASRPEPWRRLIKVLRRMGDDPSARDVAIGRERYLRRAHLIGLGAPPAWRALVRLAHGLYGLFAGYGHRPLRLLASVAALWLLGGALYWAAGAQGGLAPRAALVLAEASLASCRPECAELPATMPRFQPLVYSLDVLVPLLDLQQERHWGPVRHGLARGVGSEIGVPLLQVAMWFEAGCGWLASLILLAMATGLAHRDRDRGC